MSRISANTHKWKKFQFPLESAIVFYALPMFAGYGTSAHAGSKLTTYGFIFCRCPKFVRRFTKDVFPLPAIPSTIKHTGRELIPSGEVVPDADGAVDDEGSLLVASTEEVSILLVSFDAIVFFQILQKLFGINRINAIYAAYSAISVRILRHKCDYSSQRVHIKYCFHELSCSIVRRGEIRSDTHKHHKEW